MNRSDGLSRWAWLAWHLAAGLVAGLVPSQLRVGQSLADLPADELGLTVRIILAHWVMALILMPRSVRSASQRVWWAGLVFAACHGLLALLLLLTESFSSRSILVGGVGLSALLLVLSLGLNARRQVMGAVFLLVAVVALQFAGSRPSHWWKLAFGHYPKPHATQSSVGTSLYGLDLLSFHHHFDVCPGGRPPCTSPGNGGGLVSLGEGYLLATGRGVLHYVEVDAASRQLRKQTLAMQVPINQAPYEAAIGENTFNTFRVTDLKAGTTPDGIELFAVHHYWKVDQACGVLRVSRWRGSLQQLRAADARSDWTTLHETAPCLPATGGHLTRGSESGGRLAFVGDDRLLLTVGDHEYDGIIRTPIAAQDPVNAYGKTLMIDRRTGVARVFTSGHRNPQGLFIDSEGAAWSTEHGAQGGDEINILREGANYGWPIVTYGTQYGMRAWPHNPQQGRHQGFEPPVFAFVPSIAISQLVRLDDKMFPLWKGDLLVASYKKALYRLRLEQGRVAYVESIPVNGRIRQLLQGANGQLVLYLDSGSLIFVTLQEGSKPGGPAGAEASASTDAARGRQLFAGCSGCHARVDGRQHGIGPDLANVFGRRMAGAAGYAYSPALKARQGNWDEDSLSAFLADPQAFAAGTSMAAAGVQAPADRAALIAYLRAPGN